MSKSIQGTLLLILGVLVLIFNAWLLPMGTDGKIPLDLKFGYDLTEATQVLEELGEATLPKYLFGLMVTDMVYPFVYGSFLSLLLLRIWKKTWMLAFPVLVMLLDIGENLSILTLVDTFPALSESNVQTASFFSSSKWIMVMVTFLLFIIGMVKNFLRK